MNFRKPDPFIKLGLPEKTKQEYFQIRKYNQSSLNKTRRMLLFKNKVFFILGFFFSMRQRQKKGHLEGMPRPIM